MKIERENSMDPKQAPLLAEQASIQARSIAVKVLTIGTKQVTQSLYKQLPTGDLLQDETGAIDGTPWGWVNLHDADCRGKHLHVVYEQDGVLKKSTVVASASKGSTRHDYLYDKLSGAGRAYVLAATLEGTYWKNKEGQPLQAVVSKLSLKTSSGVHYEVFNLHSEVSSYWNNPQRLIRAREELAEIESMDETEFPDFSPYVRKQGRIDSTKEQIESILKYADEYHKSIKDDLEKFVAIEHIEPGDYSASHFKNIAEQYGEAIVALRDRWEKSYIELEATGQLFIAVSGVWK